MRHILIPVVLDMKINLFSKIRQISQVSRKYPNDQEKKQTVTSGMDAEAVLNKMRFHKLQ